MISSFKREVRGYFRGYFGWIIAAIQLLACGIFSFASTILSLSSDFTAVFSNLPLILIPLVPAVAIYTFTCEHTRGNMLWLNSLPVGATGRTVGKYLAALSLLLLPSSVLLLMPPLLANMGTVSVGSAYTAILGYFLSVAAILAICAFVASRVKNPILSTVLCTLLCLVLYFITLVAIVAEYLPWLALLICIAFCAVVGVLTGILEKNLLRGILTAGIPASILTLLYLIPDFYVRTLPNLIYFLSPFENLDGFLTGHFNLPAAIYLFSLSILFVALTACPISFRALQSRRTVTAGILLVVLLACNLLALLLPFRTAYPDVSGNNAYELSETSRRYLSSVKEDVEIIYYSSGGERVADKDLYPFLLQFSDANPHIRVRVENTEGVDGVTDETVLIRSASRSRTVSVSELYYYYNSYIGTYHTLPEYSQLLQNMATVSDTETYAQMIQVYSPGNVSAYFTGDANLTGAIRFVLAEEAPLVLSFSKGKGSGMSAFFTQQIKQASFDLHMLYRLTDLTQDAQALLLSVTEDLTDEEATALSDYLNGGGAVLLTTAYTAISLPNLNAVLADYGLATPEKKTLLYESTTASPAFEAVEGTQHPVTDLFDGSFIAAYAHPIRMTETEGVSQSVLLQTSATGTAITEGTNSAEKGSFPIGVLAKKGEGRVLWLSMMMDSYVYGISSGGTADFTECALQWITDFANTSIKVSASALPSTYLAPKDSAIMLWIIFFVILLPISSVTLGIMRVYIRKRK